MKNKLLAMRNGLTFLWLRVVGFFPSHSIRKFFYRLAGMKIGHRSYIYAGAEIRNARGISIGDDVIVGHRVILDGRCGLTIEDNVNISTGCWIWTMQHDPQSPTFAAVGAPVLISKYSWLAGRVIVLPGVVVAEGVVVASGAVVTKCFDSYVMVGGVPAKVIGQRSRNLNYQLGSDGATPFI